MEIPLQLFGSLILTLLGFILPILTILLSIFSDGTRFLTTKYENEKKQTDENIHNELKKKEAGELDYNALKRTLDILQKKKYRATVRLEYLDPIKVAYRISLPLIVSFFGILVVTQVRDSFILILAGICSLIAFACSIYAIWISLSVLTEVSDVVNESKKNTDNKIVELLSILVEKSGVDTLFLNSEKVQAKFYGKFVKQNEVYEFSVNKKYEIPVSIVNSDDRMAKDVEVGYIFPEDFLVERSPNISIAPNENKQVIRLNQGTVHAHENHLKGTIAITFLKAGEYMIDHFIKGENVKYQRLEFKIKVIE